MYYNNSKILNDVYDDSNHLLKTSAGALTGLITFEYDDVQVEYPDDTTEQFKFYKDTNLIKTLKVTYTDNTKENLLRARFI